MLISADELRNLRSLSIEDETNINAQLYNLIKPLCSGILCKMGHFKAPRLLIDNLRTLGYRVTVCEDTKTFLVQL